MRHPFVTATIVYTVAGLLISAALLSWSIYQEATGNATGLVRPFAALFVSVTIAAIIIYNSVRNAK